MFIVAAAALALAGSPEARANASTARANQLMQRVAEIEAFSRQTRQFQADLTRRMERVARYLKEIDDR